HCWRTLNQWQVGRAGAAARRVSPGRANEGSLRSSPETTDVHGYQSADRPRSTFERAASRSPAAVGCANIADLGACDRLLIGDDGQDFHRGLGERLGRRLVHEPLDEWTAIGRRDEFNAVARLEQGQSMRWRDIE